MIKDDQSTNLPLLGTPNWLRNCALSVPHRSPMCKRCACQTQETVAHSIYIRASINAIVGTSQPNHLSIFLNPSIQQMSKQGTHRLIHPASKQLIRPTHKGSVHALTVPPVCYVLLVDDATKCVGWDGNTSVTVQVPPTTQSVPFDDRNGLVGDVWINSDAKVLPVSSSGSSSTQLHSTRIAPPFFHFFASAICRDSSSC